VIDARSLAADQLKRSIGPRAPMIVEDQSVEAVRAHMRAEWHEVLEPIDEFEVVAAMALAAMHEADV
jgi:hypothetical protein